jgi:hypothetical protein
MNQCRHIKTAVRIPQSPVEFMRHWSTVDSIALDESAMPEVSRFFGISIRMYYDDHNPPHFHAIYTGSEVEVGINPIALLRGKFPRRALGMVMEWSAAHQQELLDNWELLRNDLPPRRIVPLD